MSLNQDNRELNHVLLCLVLAVALFLGYLASFVVYYLSNYIVITDLTAYIWLFFNRLTYLLFPLVTALSVFISAPFIGTGKSLLFAIPQVAVRMIYFIPYFYLKYIVEGFSSVECLGIGLILSFGEAVITFGAVVLLYFIMKLILERRGADKRSEVFKKCELDFASPTAVAIGVLSVLAAVYFIGGEIIDTVGFFADYGFTLTLPEIIFMTISYIFDILIAPIYFFVLAFIKNKLVSLFGYEGEGQAVLAMNQGSLREGAGAEGD